MLVIFVIISIIGINAVNANSIASHKLLVCAVIYVAISIANIADIPKFESIYRFILVLSFMNFGFISNFFIRYCLPSEIR